jgi:histone deacetylase complex regulatory component SIN3
VNKIKARCGADAEEYERFLEILRTYKGDMRIKEVYARVAELFKDHPDLLSEFAHFLPTWVSEPSPTPSPAPRASSSDAEVEGQAPPTPMLVDEAAVASDLSGDDGDISLDEK